jgi:hypothetical protein
MDTEQKIQTLENSVAYLLSQVNGERLQEIEQDFQQMQQEISYLLTQVEGKSKLVSLIDDLRKDNEELSKQRHKLLTENVSLKQLLSAEKAVTKKLRFLCNSGERNTVFLDKLNSIVSLLDQANSQTEVLINMSQIDE